MDTQQQQRNSREKVVDKPQEGWRLKQEGKAKQQSQAVAATSPASPPSSSSSPSHEFSFTISLHPTTSTTTPVPDYKSKTPPNSFAIDLSPADDIFFHGHLLPLHLLSHLPVSPRSSTNSLDSFTLPIKELSDDQRPSKSSNNCNSSSSSNGNSNSNSNSNSTSTSTSTSSSNDNINHCSHHQSSNNYSDQTKGRSKPKSFSLFGWRKGCEVKEKEDDDKDKHKKKLRFDVSQVLKRYARMVRPLMFFKGRRSENLQFHRQPYSFSGNLSWRNKQDQLRGRRGEYSAPASMRTSPTNSGLLLATATLPSSTSDSTMEELQAAIQAAIAHCKNSIAAEENIKC